MAMRQEAREGAQSLSSSVKYTPHFTNVVKVTIHVMSPDTTTGHAAQRILATEVTIQGAKEYQFLSQSSTGWYSTHFDPTRPSLLIWPLWCDNLIDCSELPCLTVLWPAPEGELIPKPLLQTGAFALLLAGFSVSRLGASLHEVYGYLNCSVDTFDLQCSYFSSLSVFSLRRMNCRRVGPRDNGEAWKLLQPVNLRHQAPPFLPWTFLWSPKCGFRTSLGARLVLSITLFGLIEVLSVHLPPAVFLD